MCDCPDRILCVFHLRVIRREIKHFRRAIRFSRLPRLLRRALWWLSVRSGQTRAPGAHHDGWSCRAETAQAARPHDGFIEGQREMLLPIPGEKGKDVAAKSARSSGRQRKAG